jgi:hypothetical protein
MSAGQPTRYKVEHLSSASQEIREIATYAREATVSFVL